MNEKNLSDFQAFKVLYKLKQQRDYLQSIGRIKRTKPNTMNELKLEIPEGYEVDIENSDIATGSIKLKKVEKKLPTSIDELPKWDKRFCYIDSDGEIRVGYVGMQDVDVDCIDFETREEAEATKTFLELRKLMNAWNDTITCDEHEDSRGWHSLNRTQKGFIKIYDSLFPLRSFSFKTNALAEQFLSTFKKELTLCIKYNLI